MNLENFYSFCEDMTNDSQNVTINYDNLSNLWDRVEELTKEQEKPEPKHEFDVQQLLVASIILNSVNFCYFYGRPCYRPDGYNSYNFEQAFLKKLKEDNINYVLPIQQEFHYQACVAYDLLMEYHFVPLKNEKLQFLDEFIRIAELNPTFPFFVFVQNMIEEENDFDQNTPLFVELLKTTFKSFAEDPFMKRTVLTPMTFERLNRDLGNGVTYFNDFEDLPIPVDYHIPNILRHFECLTYSDYLADIVDNEKNIEANSKLEIEIRAATVVATRFLKKITGVSMNEIDESLFSLKGMVTTTHHMTNTTAY